MTQDLIKAAIIDYELGNLFSVQQACRITGIEATITTDVDDLEPAELIILPGIGAYEDAMRNLRRLGMVQALRDIAEAGDRMLVGICLGQQLFMSESYEFGTHKGLDIIPGAVIKLEKPVGVVAGESRALKVPQVGWNGIHHPTPTTDWTETPLQGLSDGELMYFVHSYHVQLADEAHALAHTTYGQITFASAIQHKHVFAAQFHPERSGHKGLQFYHNIAARVQNLRQILG